MVTLFEWCKMLRMSPARRVWWIIRYLGNGRPVRIKISDMVRILSISRKSVVRAIDKLVTNDYLSRSGDLFTPHIWSRVFDYNEGDGPPPWKLPKPEGPVTFNPIDPDVLNIPYFLTPPNYHTGEPSAGDP